jgi:hypothetical protein
MPLATEPRLLDDLPLEQVRLRARGGQRGEGAAGHMGPAHPQSPIGIVREHDVERGFPGFPGGVGEERGHPRAQGDLLQDRPLEVVDRAFRDILQKDPRPVRGA